MKTQMLRFGMAGAAGYVVDSVVLYAMMGLGMDFLSGRLVSFLCAVVVTFLLNRRYTFAGQLHEAASMPTPLWLEFGRYLAAMALGGLLNLLTYWFVLEVTPHFPALFALAVAAGSLVGMAVNFASAKWWVFAHRPGREAFALPTLRLTTARCLVVVQAVFWLSQLHEAGLPGLYMDAVNPDYLAARTLNPELPNPVWLQPTIGLPVIGALYHGVQTYYVGLPVFALLGFNMLALRIAQGLFAGGILVMTQLVLQRASGSLALAFAGSLGLATELAFIASFRTQMYIVMAGAFWLLLAIYLALGRGTAAPAPPATGPAAGIGGRRFAEFPALPWFLSGLCAGLAVYSYFVFLFFVPVFVVMGWWHTRNWHAAVAWLLGFALGMQTYVLGYTLAFVALGGIGPGLGWLGSSSQGLGPMSSELGIGERLLYAWHVLTITLQGTANEQMIFGASVPGVWAVWKARLLALTPLLLIALARVHRRKLLDHAEAREAASAGMLAPWHVALLPLAFVAASMVFGDRLWSHHFSPLIPLSYVALFLAVHHALRARPLPGMAGIALMAAVIIGNVQQQQAFFERLVATGGVGLFSNAINRMADDALSLPADLVHVFPEWGFGMPFALLTGNRRAYEANVSDATLQRLADSGKTLRLYYWQPDTENTYRDLLQARGFQISATGAYLQRNQETAFYWLEAAAPGSAR